MADSISQGQALNRSSEAAARSASGYGMLLVLLVTVAVGIFGATRLPADPALAGVLIVVAAIAFMFVLSGFYMIQPNQAVAITLFGSYKGTDRSAGLRWVLPWMGRKKLSVRANNIISDKIKVNDLRGNPIEMAAQVVWRVTDTAQALFDVDDYKAFVMVQIEAAVRTIGWTGGAAAPPTWRT